MIILLNHMQLLGVNNGIVKYRISIQLNMDAFSGFGSTTVINSTWALYAHNSQYDPWTNQYFVLPFTQPLFAAGSNATCDVLRQKSNVLSFRFPSTKLQLQLRKSSRLT